MKSVREDPEWFARLFEHGFTADSIFDEGQHEDLKTRLLSNGGDAVILAFIDSDKDAILERGLVFDGKSAKPTRGRQALAMAIAHGTGIGGEERSRSCYRLCSFKRWRLASTLMDI